MRLDVTHNGVGDRPAHEEDDIPPYGHLEPLLSQFGNVHVDILIGMMMILMLATHFCVLNRNLAFDFDGDLTPRRRRHRHRIGERVLLL